MNKERITHVKKDNLDRVVEFKTNLGHIYNYEVAKELIEKDIIVNADIYVNQYGIRKIKEKERVGEFRSFPEFK